MALKSAATLNIAESEVEKSGWKPFINRMLALVLCILIIAAISYLIMMVIMPALKPIVVETRFGAVEGFRQLRLGKTVYIFLGIPFAAPPVGDLRLRKPRDPIPWKGVLSAKEKPVACHQYMSTRNVLHTSLINKTPQSEDCLYLNVYVPGKIDRKRKHAVMVWIHGGAFLVGSTRSYDGAPLAAYGDVIVVTIAYRLGLLGFMVSTHRDQIPGNMGLHDQVKALKWINENIEAFGGDPTNVTIFGQSAGGVSAGFHMISPLSRMYFKRAIMESGSPLTPVMMIGNEAGPLKVEKVAKYTNCPYTQRKKDEKYSTFTNETYDCLRHTDIKNLIQSQTSIIESWKDMAFYPIEDHDFFPIHPYDSIKASDFGEQKEVLLGANKNDGAYFLSYGMPDLFPDKKQLPQNLTLDDMANKMKKFGTNKMSDKYQMVLEFLFGGDDTNSSKVANRMDKLLGAALFLCPNIIFIDAFTKLANRTAYYYQFNPRPSTAKFMKWAKGAVHHDEVYFVLGYPVDTPNKYTQDEVELSRIMMDDWLHFAKFGVPMPSHEWSPCVGSERFHMVYDLKKLTLMKGLPDNRCEQYFDNFYEEAKNGYRYYNHK